MARAVIGSTAAAGLATGGLLAITPDRAAADRASVSDTTQPTRAVPAPSLATTSASTATQPYTVAAGDTLSRIGAAADEPWQTVYADNQAVIGADPNRIFPGQRLLLDAGLPTAPAAAVMANTAPAPVAAPPTGRHAAPADGQDVVNQARAYLGVPYVWAGSSPAGMDCSGLVLRVFANLGVSLPHSSAAQSGLGALVGSLSQAEPGDLVFFDNPVGHVGIYIGGGQMIAAPTFGDVVKVQSVYTTPTAIRRLV